MCELHGENHEHCICIAPFKFHCLPNDVDQRREWLRAINRKDYNPTGKALVCSRHFADGRPTKENRTPTLHMGYQKLTTPKARRHLVRKSPVAATVPVTTFEKPEQEPEVDLDVIMDSPSGCTSDTCTEQARCNSTFCNRFPESCQNVSQKPVLVDASTQTEDVMKRDHSYSFAKTSKSVSIQHTTPEFTMDNISSDTDARFYTGLNLTVFMSLVSTLKPFGKDLSYKLNIADQILSVLIRLRLGLNFHDIARRLNISRQLAASIFHSWIDIMAVRLSDCIVWLPRESIRRTLPSSFSDTYPKTTCIIDCTEVFIQRPFTLKARNQTYTSYKNHNTANSSLQ